MANITELQLQGDSTVHKLNDARITTTPITNPTHILGSKNANLTSIAPITIANLASVLGGSQIGDGNGFVKFINTYIDDTIDNCTPNGIYPLFGGDTSGRGFVFRFFSAKHYRALEIRFVDQQMPSFRFFVSGQWSEWIQTPSFYSNYPDLTSLASALGVYRGNYRVNTAAGTLNKYLKINMNFSVCNIYYDEQNKTGSTAQIYMGHSGNHIGKYVIQGGTSITVYSASDGFSLYILLNHDGFIGFDVHDANGAVTGWEIVDSLPSGATQISLT